MGMWLLSGRVGPLRDGHFRALSKVGGLEWEPIFGGDCSMYPDEGNSRSYRRENSILNTLGKKPRNYVAKEEKAEGKKQMESLSMRKENKSEKSILFLSYDQRILLIEECSLTLYSSLQLRHS